jgi:hypothetical protein
MSEIPYKRFYLQLHYVTTIYDNIDKITTTAAATLILAMTASMVATAYAAFGEELISVRFRRNTYSNR